MGGDLFVCLFLKSSQVPAVMRTAEVGWGGGGRTHAAAPRTTRTPSHTHIHTHTSFPVETGTETQRHDHSGMSIWYGLLKLLRRESEADRTV